jgi:hypothetical protein
MAHNLLHVQLSSAHSNGRPQSEGCERAQQEKSQQLAERQTHRSDLLSVELTAGERIRRWENLYGVGLPLEAHHPAILILARDTGLPLGDIEAEQRRRTAKVIATRL